MYVLRNNEAHCCNHYCSEKAINIRYTETEFVASTIHYAIYMHHIVVCGLSECTNFQYIFSRSVINGTIFGKYSLTQSMVQESLSS